MTAKDAPRMVTKRMTSTLHAAAEDIRSGRRTPIDLLKACLERIDRLEDRIHAWVSVDREGARADAERLTTELHHGHWRGPLHGIPIGVKDIFDVANWPTAAGSRLWKDRIASQDATVVRQLREAGAVFVGKTVTTQYASFDPPPTRNPWDVSRTPGGSSSGSAAALACGMSRRLARRPAARSRARRHIAAWLASSRPSAALASKASCRWRRRWITSASWRVASAILRLSFKSLQIRKIAIRRGRLVCRRAWADFAVCSRLKRNRSSCARWTRRLIGSERRGDDHRDKVAPAVCGRDARHRAVMAVEAAVYHEARSGSFPDDYDPNIRALIEEGLACPAPVYARARLLQTKLREEMLACFANVDALLTPATTGPAPDAATTGDPLFNSPWSFTGLPTVCFPAGRSPDGLPLGLQLVGAPGSEDGLLTVAAWCEDSLEYAVAEPAL